MHTRVIFEMDAPSAVCDAILIALRVSLGTHCPKLNPISIVPRYDPEPPQCRMASGIVHTAEQAAAEIGRDPETDVCILISPRAISASRYIIPATIYVVRNREKLIAAGVHLIHNAPMRAEAQRLVFPETLHAKELLFGACGPTTADKAFADSVERAIDDSYQKSYVFVHSYAGTA